jgi:hypothetical protein
LVGRLHESGRFGREERELDEAAEHEANERAAELEVSKSS